MHEQRLERERECREGTIYGKGLCTEDRKGLQSMVHGWWSSKGVIGCGFGRASTGAMVGAARMHGEEDVVCRRQAPRFMSYVGGKTEQWLV